MKKFLLFCLIFCCVSCGYKHSEDFELTNYATVVSQYHRAAYTTVSHTGRTTMTHHHPAVWRTTFECKVDGTKTQFVKSGKPIYEKYPKGSEVMISYHKRIVEHYSKNNSKKSVHIYYGDFKLQ